MAERTEQTANSDANQRTAEELLITVAITPLELKLFRRALAKAADEGLLERTAALHRICALDVLRWEAEEQAGKPTAQKENPMRRAA